MDFALLAALILMPGLAACAVASRGYGASRRSEQGVVVGTLWLALLCAPVHVLGWLDALDARSLGVTTSALSALTFIAACASRSPLREVRRTFALAASMLRLPWDALRLAIDARSIAVVAYLGAAFVMAWTTWLAWLAPSSSWDGVWYHDAIVGFAIQNRGFRTVELPTIMQHVNGYPKLVEYLQLWLSIFTERRLADAVPSLTAPLLVLVFHATARRYGFWRTGGIGLGSTLFMVPGIALQCRSTYIDGVVMTLLVLAVYFVTRPALRVRDAFMASVGLALFGASKGVALVIVPMFCLILLVRLLRARGSAVGKLAAIVLGTSLIVSAMAPTYLRNHRDFHNPLWPYPFKSELIGVDWQGPAVLPVHGQQDFFDDLLTAPKPGEEFPDTRHNGYGNAPVFVVFPLAFFAFFLAIRRSFQGGSAGRDARNVLLVAFPLMLSCATSPAIWWARYALQGLFALFLLTAWLLARAKPFGFAEGVVGALAVGGLVTLLWSTPAWDVTREQALQLAAQSAQERATFRASNWLPEPDVVRAREAELGPGDVVAFPTDAGFPGAYWNDHCSNRLVWVEWRYDPSAYLEALDAASAEWVVVPSSGGEFGALEAHPERWQRVGNISSAHVAFRRVR